MVDSMTEAYLHTAGMWRTPGRGLCAAES